MRMEQIMERDNISHWFKSRHEDELDLQPRFYAYTEEGPSGIFFISSSKDPKTRVRRYTVRVYCPEAADEDMNCMAVGPIHAFSSFQKAFKAVKIFIKVETAYCAEGIRKEDLWMQHYPANADVQRQIVEFKIPSAVQITAVEVANDAPDPSLKDRA